MLECSLFFMRFAVLAFGLSCLSAFRSRTNYGLWLKNGHTSRLVVARNQHSVSETAFLAGRLALLLGIAFFVVLSTGDS